MTSVLLVFATSKTLFFVYLLAGVKCFCQPVADLLGRHFRPDGSVLCRECIRQCHTVDTENNECRQKQIGDYRFTDPAIRR